MCVTLDYIFAYGTDTREMKQFHENSKNSMGSLFIS